MGSPAKEHYMDTVKLWVLQHPFISMGITFVAGAIIF